MADTVPACPSCRAPMQAHRFRRKLGGEVMLDICLHCQGIWFDVFESLQLAPEGVVELFRLIQEQPDNQRLPLAASLFCPRCTQRLIHSQDRVKSGRFNYLRCGEHGRFISFGQFMIEKGFVRQVSPAEIKQLKLHVTILRCNSCGAPVDIRTESACPHCRAPIAVLDADAVEKALAGYLAGSATRAVTMPPFSPARHRHATAGAGRGGDAAAGIVDLVGEGVASVWQGVGD
ncbi:MAG: zf-TFIIB domain-containing protein [Rhodocyclales bacterium]|nr:zf-TFIIB domain-containing protein [Rhodocyclales bacterium]